LFQRSCRRSSLLVPETMQEKQSPCSRDHAGEAVSLFQGPNRRSSLLVPGSCRRSSLLVPGPMQEKQSPYSRAHVWDAAQVGSQNNPGHCPASQTTYRTNLFNCAFLVFSGATPAKWGQVFCFLSSSPLPTQATTAVFGSNPCHLSTFN
jgi:hypothetical protein